MYHLNTFLLIDIVSLPGGCMGGFSDLFGQNSQQLGVPDMGPHMPAQLPVHLRSRHEFQPFAGTRRHGLHGKLIKNAHNTI